jgi:transcriptional regulator with XRE-family HTH domain
MMARMCGVTQSAVSNWQGARDYQPPGRDQITTLARVTGASADWILSGTGAIPHDLQAKVIAIHTGKMKPPNTPRKKRTNRGKT